MTQIDILLGQQPKEYDLQIGNTKTLNVVLNDRTHYGNVSIYGLLDRQGIYGNELKPLISYLSENEVECILNVGLLDLAFLFMHDDSLLSSFHEESIFIVERGGGYNLFLLSSNAIATKNTAYTATPHEEARLTLSIAEKLLNYLSLANNVSHLTGEIDVDRIAVLSAQNSIYHLTTEMRSQVEKICAIIMNVCGLHWFTGLLRNYDDMLLDDMSIMYPNLSLHTLPIGVYMKFYLGTDEHEMSLDCEIQDFVGTSSITNVPRNNLSLDDSLYFSYQIFCSCGLHNISVSVQAPIPRISTFVQTDGSEASLLSSVIEAVYAESGIGCTSSCSLSTTLGEISMCYGVARFDDYLLQSIDGFTLYNMGKELPYESTVDTADDQAL